MKQTSFISTSIPYVNAAPHIGHAVEFVQADALARYRRLLGDDVFFLSGTDENALKNVLKAEEEGEPVADYVNRHAAIFKELLEKLNARTDDFIRTSVDPRHARGAQKLWRACNPRDIYKKVYKGLYCVGCEEFKHERDLADGHCREHPWTMLEEVEEENYFFRLGNYQKQLETLIADNTLRIIPETRKNEVLSFIRGGLPDLSISRSTERARGWGVPVPEDDTQVMYVWIEALSNYITALGYADDSPNFKRYWINSDERLHVIGKGISRFHALYWPAFLLSAGVPLPTTLFVHGYIIVGGQKMSKSLGNVVDPFDVLADYPTDAVRYYLLRHVHPFEDSDLTLLKFKEAYNANLANGLGNLVARIMKLAETHLSAPVPCGELVFDTSFSGPIDSFQLQKFMDDVWEYIGHVDALIQIEKPFTIVKKDAQKGSELIIALVKKLHVIAGILQPVMPETATHIDVAIKQNKMPETLFPRKA